MPSVILFTPSEDVDWLTADMTRSTFGYVSPEVHAEFRRFVFRDLQTFAVAFCYFLGALAFSIMAIIREHTTEAERIRDKYGESWNYAIAPVFLRACPSYLHLGPISTRAEHPASVSKRARGSYTRGSQRQCAEEVAAGHRSVPLGRSVVRLRT